LDKKQLKQRIVGAIVLIGLGVIFIPVILNQGDHSSLITGSNIPPKPVELARMPEQVAPPQPSVPTANRDLPKLVDEHTPPITQIDTSVTESKTVIPPTEKTTVTIKSDIKASSPTKTDNAKTVSTTPKATLPTQKTRAWVVQVASFSEQQKAIKLRDRLRKAGHPGFVESITNKKGRYFRVRIGPVVKRSKADKLKKKIAKQFKLKDALVMAHP